MPTQMQPKISTPTLSPAERRALHVLRARYRRDRDLFGEREMAHLRFLRWLYRTGRLVP